MTNGDLHDDRLMTREAAQILGVHRSTLLRWVKHGEIRALDRDPRQTGALKFSRTEIQRLAAARQTAKAS